MATIEQLKKRIDRCEESLQKEHERQHSVLERQGWGYGMRHSKIGVSNRRERELKSRLEKLILEYKIIENKS